MSNHELALKVLADMRDILADSSLPLSKRLDEVEWRREFLNELLN
jgi:hypothetical protein